ncbi:MAG: hypothetical protein DMF91_27260, partial [Acidobacteria bacterium]
AAADPRGIAFKTILTPEQIEALSDDPAEMLQQLLDMASPNAVIRVDSFFGGPLPPKAQIKSIHIVRDAFAAENHSAESDEIQIITQPGVGPIHGGGNSRFRDGSMSARSPFTQTRGPERTQNVEGNIGGSLIKNKSSFSISVGRRSAFDTPTLYVALPGGGTRSEVMNLRRPNDNWSVFGLFDYALTRDQTLRLSYDQSNSRRRNLGVGGYDLDDRAYSTDVQDHELRAQIVGPLGRRMFANTRLQVAWVDSASQARRAGDRRTPSAQHRVRVGYRLHPRHQHGACRRARRQRLVPLERLDQLPGHLHVYEHRCVRCGPACQLHTPDRQSAD